MRSWYEGRYAVHTSILMISCSIYWITKWTVMTSGKKRSLVRAYHTVRYAVDLMRWPNFSIHECLYLVGHSDCTYASSPHTHRMRRTLVRILRRMMVSLSPMAISLRERESTVTVK